MAQFGSDTIKRASRVSLSGSQQSSLSIKQMTSPRASLNPSLKPAACPSLVFLKCSLMRSGNCFATFSMISREGSVEASSTTINSKDRSPVGRRGKQRFFEKLGAVVVGENDGEHGGPATGCIFADARPGRTGYPSCQAEATGHRPA